MSDDELAKYLSIVDEAEKEAERTKAEEIRAANERNAAANEVAEYIKSATDTMQRGLSGLLTATRRAQRQTRSFSINAEPTKSEKFLIGDIHANTLYLFVFPHPKVHPTRGALHACIGLAKSTINAKHGWRLHEFTSADAGVSGLKNVTATRHLNVGDAYTQDMVKETSNNLLATINALYTRKRDDDEDD
ncbi:hypothetical protein [Sorangium cellulosum]|uniref:hypothetical protein n=1 Tax=Sorangium cellulosum TaxID=56 RepID=UPI000B147105|nr:hypothetical protein [Sorangium cellulosum]